MEGPLGLGGHGLELCWGFGIGDVDGLEVRFRGREFLSGGTTLKVPLNVERVGFCRLCGREGGPGLGGR